MHGYLPPEGGGGLGKPQNDKFRSPYSTYPPLWHEDYQGEANQAMLPSPLPPPRRRYSVDFGKANFKVPKLYPRSGGGGRGFTLTPALSDTKDFLLRSYTISTIWQVVAHCDIHRNNSLLTSLCSKYVTHYVHTNLDWPYDCPTDDPNSNWRYDWATDRLCPLYLGLYLITQVMSTGHFVGNRLLGPGIAPIYKSPRTSLFSD